MNKKLIALLIVTILFSSFTSSISGVGKNNGTITEINLKDKGDAQEDVVITCYSLGLLDQTITEIEMSYCEVEELFDTMSMYSVESSRDPQSEETQQLYQEIIRLADSQKLLPACMSSESTQFSFNSFLHSRDGNAVQSPLLQNKASAFFCNFATTGTGSQFPIIIFPRLIPILQLPIPRAFLRWTATEGITSCGGLLNGKGFIGYGQQTGLALGFWGIGFSVFLPPLMQYGFIGYALYASADAEVIELWPPNSPPVISQIDPGNGEINVPLSTDEIRFQISDVDGELMSYEVTTNPDIGSGSGNLKTDGVYSIPISGLEDLTEYSWHIEVTDGKDTTFDDFTFTTEAIAPIVSNPVPADGERDVPMDIPCLCFTLHDYQGDAMDYTVETSPDIGSAQATGVHDATYTVSVSGLMYGATYRWYVNATDGTHWTQKMFSFETGYPSQYNPFDFGWQYRKQIIIDSTQVTDDLEDFPVLISTTDDDLIKAQVDGSDILFMDSDGVASRQYHEVETFDHTTGSLVCWVNMPELSSLQDTVLYIYYGNPTCIDQEYPEKVWNSHFRAVWHLQDSPSGSILDSTSNNNDATSHGGMGASNLIQGKVGKCLDFDGINDYLTAPDSPSLNPTEVTLICWLRSEEDITVKSTLGKGCTDIWGNKDAVSYGLRYADGEIGSNAEKDNNRDTFAKYNATIDIWYHTAMTYDSSSKDIQYYQNGVLQDTVNHGQSLRYDGPWDFVVAAGHTGIGSGINYYADCKIDEIWLLDAPLTSDWISTAFQNQNDPSSFMSIGPEEPAP